MDYHWKLRRALIKWLGRDNVVFHKGWQGAPRNIVWQGPGKVPNALVCHHTAGALTESTDPLHPLNQAGVHDGIIQFVQSHYPVPAANFTIDRNGCLHVHSAYPVWHAGRGSFDVWPYSSLNIPKDMGNDYMLGVEVIDKGLRRTFTRAQKDALGALAQACREASGWKGFTKRLPNHKTWAGRRKNDTKYPLAWLIAWAVWAGKRGPVE